MTPAKESLAERVKRSRAEAKLTQNQLGTAAGISSAAIGLIEIGDTKAIRSEHLFAIARAVNKNPEWLANGRGPERPPGALDTIIHALPAEARIKVLDYTKYIIDTTTELRTSTQRTTYSTRIDQLINETKHDPD